MPSTAELLKEAGALAKLQPSRAEALFKEILTSSSSFSADDPQQQAQLLRDQETALVDLGKLYRDQTYACIYKLV